jgi:hypothetical protein
MEWFYVYDMEIDNLGNIWLASYEGVWKFDGLDWTNWNESNSAIASNHVWAIEVDNTGKVYIGAHETLNWPYYGGISVFNGETWTTYLEGSSPVLHKQVEDIELDNFGNLWILTQTMGLTLYNENGLENIFECQDFTFDVSNDYNSIAESTTYFDSIEVYPNPAETSINIQIGNKEVRICNLAIRNNQGQLIYETSNASIGNNQTFEIDTSQFSEGYYFITLTSSNSYQAHTSFIKI